MQRREQKVVSIASRLLAECLRESVPRISFVEMEAIAGRCFCLTGRITCTWQPISPVSMVLMPFSQALSNRRNGTTSWRLPETRPMLHHGTYYFTETGTCLPSHSILSDPDTNWTAASAGGAGRMRQEDVRKAVCELIL